MFSHEVHDKIIKQYYDFSFKMFLESSMHLSFDFLCVMWKVVTGEKTLALHLIDLLTVQEQSYSFLVILVLRINAEREEVKIRRKIQSWLAT